MTKTAINLTRLRSQFPALQEIGKQDHLYVRVDRPSHTNAQENKNRLTRVLKEICNSSLVWLFCSSRVRDSAIRDLRHRSRTRFELKANSYRDVT